MAKGVEIVVEDPDAASGASAADSPPVTSIRTADVVVSLLLLALAALLGFDNWRTGMGWDATGPQAGYFPFYLCVILAAACVWGLAKEYMARKQAAESFVTRDQLRRVLQVFVPTLAFCLLTQWLGLYVASFLLIASFMIFVGRIAAWKSLLTALVFSVAMFVTFQIAFDVIMPKGPLEGLLGY
jgi:putative tricarboxylic transport membrane protein